MIDPRAFGGLLNPLLVQTSQLLSALPNRQTSITKDTTSASPPRSKGSFRISDILDVDGGDRKFAPELDRISEDGAKSPQSISEIGDCSSGK